MRCCEAQFYEVLLARFIGLRLIESAELLDALLVRRLQMFNQIVHS